MPFAFATLVCGGLCVWKMLDKILSFEEMSLNIHLSFMLLNKRY